MNDRVDANTGAPIHNGAPASRAPRNGMPEPPAVDFWSFAEILLRHWRWPTIAGAALAVAGLLFGLLHWKSTYTAPAQVMSYNSPNATEIFGEREVSPQTLISVLRSPELLQAAGAQAQPPVSGASLAACLSIMPDHNSDIIVVTVTDRKSPTAMELVNLYAKEAVRFTQQLQAKSAGEMDQFISEQLTNVDTEISALDRAAGALPSLALFETNAAMSSSASLPAQLQTAREDLVQLLVKYTDAHPLVQEKKAEIAAIEDLLATNARGAGTNSLIPYAGGPLSGENDPLIVRSKLEVLEHTRLALLDKQQAVRAFEANPPGFCRLLAPATVRDLVTHSRRAKVFFLSVFAAVLGMVGGAAAVLLVEVADDRLKTPADVRRVTHLPVLAVGGDLARLNENERYDWAFRTWTRLQGRLSPSPNHGLVLGVTSAGCGEGRSTWVRLLAEAASLLGFRVLTIATRPSPRDWEAREAVAAGTNGKWPPEISDSNSEPNPEPEEASVAMTSGSNVLATPAEVAERLTGPNSQPVVHIPLPGWVWNLERRKQWREALQHWSQIENVVILVELPAASVPEAVLLAENLPNVVWLTASGQAGAIETSEQLETLRHARCRLAGAVLNRAPESFLRKRFCRWLNGTAVLIALSSSGLHAAESTGLRIVPPTNTVTQTSQTAGSPISKSAVTTTPLTPAALETRATVPRADWQQHFTLGAGDVLNLSLYGEPTLSQLNVPIGPDGRVSYLEAQDVMAAGLTIDELRTKLDEELAKYRRSPHVIITPAAFNSKKYYLLGSVTRAGAYTLDQPTTIVEAIARAHGFETVLQQRNLVDIADLQRAFLVRSGRRLPVDFEKLFSQGDRSQNIPLAPDDYLYIPPADLKEVYVVGEVQAPGPASYNTHLSALGAIAEQGGFTKRAWEQKVLVIRGSLNHPQAFVVDAKDVLAARAADFKLEPNDIVYVHYRPWAKAEDVLDLAATAFVQSAVIVWTGIHAGPLITHPIIN